MHEKTENTERAISRKYKEIEIGKSNCYTYSTMITCIARCEINTRN